MKHTLLAIYFICTALACASYAKSNSVAEPMALNYEEFRQLSTSEQERYVILLREFLVARDQAQFFDVASRSPLFQQILHGLHEQAFAATLANSRCNEGKDISALSPAIQTIINNDRDNCVIAGTQVCMAINGTRLTCILGDLSAADQKKLRGQCQTNEVQCPSFLSADENGKPVCLAYDAKTPHLTEKCFTGNIANAVKWINKNPKVQKELNDAAETLNRYCDPRNLHSFDRRDCNAFRAGVAELRKGISPAASARSATTTLSATLAANTTAKPGHVKCLYSKFPSGHEFQSVTKPFDRFEERQGGYLQLVDTVHRYEFQHRKPDKCRGEIGYIYVGSYADRGHTNCVLKAGSSGAVASFTQTSPFTSDQASRIVANIPEKSRMGWTRIERRFDPDSCSVVIWQDAVGEPVGAPIQDPPPPKQPQSAKLIIPFIFRNSCIPVNRYT